MPIARLHKHIKTEAGTMILVQHCVLLRENDHWVVLDPENNNELVKGASTAFIKSEIAADRLHVDPGWDLGIKD